MQFFAHTKVHSKQNKNVKDVFQFLVMIFCMFQKYFSKKKNVYMYIYTNANNEILIRVL